MLNAGASAAGVIPYVGDTAKITRLGQLEKAVDEGLQVARYDTRAAALLRPLMKALERSLHALPLERLPGPVRGQVEAAREKLTQGLASLRPPAQLAHADGSASEAEIADQAAAIASRSEQAWKGNLKTVPRDEKVNRDPPEVNKDLDRDISKFPKQDFALELEIHEARARGATDFRVNQHQVNAAGQRVGINRPDSTLR